MSPILFIFFINELTSLLHENGVRGLQLSPDVIEIFILLFADDVA